MRFLLLLSFLIVSAPAHANITLSEVKGGAFTQASSWVDNDEPLQPWIQHDEGGASINGELLFNGPDIFKHIYTPRIQLGANVSTADETSYAYTGLYWDRDFCDKFFVGGFFGLAVHDGTTTMSTSNPHYNNTRLLGNRVLFHLGPEIGYRLNDHWNIAANWTHLSHGWILDGFDGSKPNEGLDQLGVRLGYKF